jgi:hypothetical protein
MKTSLRFSLAAVVALTALACGGSSGNGIDDPNGPAPGGSGSGSSPSDPAKDPSKDPNKPQAPSASGPSIKILMKGSTAKFTHNDAFAGETPIEQTVAVRSLWLLRSPNDPNPVKIFEHDHAKAVEVDVVSGKTVELASVVAKTLPAGVYTMARSGISYVRYSVAARMHTTLGAVNGQYDNVQAMSDGAIIGNQPRKKGHFRYAFSSNGTTYGALEGEDAPTPVTTTTGGISLDTSGPESFYVYPVQVAIDPNISVDHIALFDVNVYESFRWQDQTQLGYQAKVFDTTPSTFEPVMAFGANAFTLTFAPAPAK